MAKRKSPKKTLRVEPGPATRQDAEETLNEIADSIEKIDGEEVTVVSGEAQSGAPEPDDLHARIQRSDAALKSAAEELKRMQAERDGFTDKIVENTARIAELETELSNARDEIVARDDRIKLLEGELDCDETEKDDLENAVEQLEKQDDELRGTIEMLTAELTKRDEAVAMLRRLAEPPFNVARDIAGLAALRRIAGIGGARTTPSSIGMATIRIEHSPHPIQLRVNSREVAEFLDAAINNTMEILIFASHAAALAGIEIDVEGEHEPKVPANDDEPPDPEGLHVVATLPAEPQPATDGEPTGTPESA